MPVNDSLIGAVTMKLSPCPAQHKMLLPELRLTAWRRVPVWLLHAGTDRVRGRVREGGTRRY
jgi:hypothetical protein